MAILKLHLSFVGETKLGLTRLLRFLPVFCICSTSAILIDTLTVTWVSCHANNQLYQPVQHILPLVCTFLIRTVSPVLYSRTLKAGTCAERVSCMEAQKEGWVRVRARLWRYNTPLPKTQIACCLIM